jgi:glutamine amidotransferase
MCRHLGWLGAPRSLADLVLDPPFSLLVQSYAPRRQRHGTVNADGWGVGFYTPGRPEPARWRSARPLWTDSSFASVAPVLRSGCVLAAVRSATVGMPLEESAAAPFTDGRWLLSHNGRVDRTVLPPVREAESTVDSALLAALVFDRGPGHLGAVVTEVGARDPAARLNVLATDGVRLLATTWGDTLSLRTTPSGTALASEPWDDDPGWTDVPDHSFVEVTPDGVSVTALAPGEQDTACPSR